MGNKNDNEFLSPQNFEPQKQFRFSTPCSKI